MPESSPFRYLSGGAERVLGRPASFWLADPGAFYAHLHPEDRPGVLAGLLAASDGTRVEAEHRSASTAAAGGCERRRGWSRTRRVPVLQGAFADVTRDRAATRDRDEAEGQFRKVVEAVRYRFEIVSDYGGFRDLQRHRMLTCQWQRLGPDLGAGIPEEVREAGVGAEYERALEISRREFERLESAGLAEAAPYALCLGYRIRYLLDLNAREAMHLCELRSGREGHPTYRAVAQAMHERIAAVHPAIAAAMRHVDSSTEPRLERILSEIRTQRKRFRSAAQPVGRTARRQLARLARR